MSSTTPVIPVSIAELDSISTASRYAGLPALTQGVRVELEPREVQVLPEGAEDDGDFYVVELGDRIDNLAYKCLGDSRLWWLVADFNPHVDPFVLQPGQVVYIPSVELAARYA